MKANNDTPLYPKKRYDMEEDPTNDLYKILDDIDFTPTAILMSHRSTAKTVELMRAKVVAKTKEYIKKREELAYERGKKDHDIKKIQVN